MLVTILKKYVWVINLILLTGLAYLLALAVNGKIEGKIKSGDAVASQRFEPTDIDMRNKSPRRKPESYYSVILTRNIFGISAGNTTTSPNGLSEEPPESSLNLILLGTIMNPDAASVAIIKNPDNSKVEGYRGGEQIDIISKERVKLVKVKNCRAVIERIGKPHETIKCKNLGDVATTPKVKNRSSRRPARANQRNKRVAEDTENYKDINKISENEYEISREILDEVLGDPTRIMQEARVIPQKDGLRFFGIRSNIIFWKIGIKNGDTLHKINNVELNDVERALGVFEELRGQSYFTIDFTRAGQKYTYEYTVK